MAPDSATKTTMTTWISYSLIPASSRLPKRCFFIFSNATTTPEIYTFPYTTLFRSGNKRRTRWGLPVRPRRRRLRAGVGGDRKSTRLNSSHVEISYAVFCLKKKRRQIQWRHQEVLVWQLPLGYLVA